MEHEVLSFRRDCSPWRCRRRNAVRFVAWGNRGCSNLFGWVVGVAAADAYLRPARAGRGGPGVRLPNCHCATPPHRHSATPPHRQQRDGTQWQRLTRTRPPPAGRPGVVPVALPPATPTAARTGTQQDNRSRYRTWEQGEMRIGLGSANRPDRMSVGQGNALQSGLPC